MDHVLKNSSMKKSVELGSRQFLSIILNVSNLLTLLFWSKPCGVRSVYNIWCEKIRFIALVFLFECIKSSCAAEGRQPPNHVMTIAHVHLTNLTEEFGTILDYGSIYIFFQR
jgi:hypothetical protein